MFLRRIIQSNLSKSTLASPVERTSNILITSGLLGGMAGVSYASYKGINAIVESAQNEEKISQRLVVIPLAPLCLFFGGVVGAHIGLAGGSVAAIARAMPKTSIATISVGALAGIASTVLKPK